MSPALRRRKYKVGAAGRQNKVSLRFVRHTRSKGRKFECRSWNAKQAKNHSYFTEHDRSFYPRIIAMRDSSMEVGENNGTLCFGKTDRGRNIGIDSMTGCLK